MRQFAKSQAAVSFDNYLNYNTAFSSSQCPLTSSQPAPTMPGRVRERVAMRWNTKRNSCCHTWLSCDFTVKLFAYCNLVASGNGICSTANNTSLASEKVGYDGGGVNIRPEFCDEEGLLETFSKLINRLITFYDWITRMSQLPQTTMWLQTLPEVLHR